MPASSDPSCFCGLYSTSTFAKARVTISARFEPPPSDSATEVIITSFILMTRNSCCPLPAFRCVIVASFRCCPVAQPFRSAGEALSILCVKERSWNVAFPAPPPLPTPCGLRLSTPQDQLRTSISSLCLSSIDSPLMSPSFAKMSDATMTSPAWPIRPAVRARLLGSRGTRQGRLRPSPAVGRRELPHGVRQVVEAGLLALVPLHPLPRVPRVAARRKQGAPVAEHPDPDAASLQRRDLTLGMHLEQHQARRIRIAEQRPRQPYLDDVPLRGHQRSVVEVPATRVGGADRQAVEPVQLDG